MKKVKLTGKLSLNKETITKLTNEQMNVINGATVGNTQCCTNLSNCCPYTQTNCLCSDASFCCF